MLFVLGQFYPAVCYLRIVADDVNEFPYVQDTVELCTVVGSLALRFYNLPHTLNRILTNFLGNCWTKLGDFLDGPKKDLHALQVQVHWPMVAIDIGIEYGLLACWIVLQYLRVLDGSGLMLVQTVDNGWDRPGVEWVEVSLHGRMGLAQ